MRFLAILSVSLLGFSPLHAEDAVQRHIAVSGEGVVSQAPDMAMVTLGVSREARLAGQAMRATSEAMAEVLLGLESAGLETRDIQTTNIGLFPRYERTNDGRQPRVVGYIASNDVQIRVRDLDALGGILDAVVGDGANQMNGIQFMLSDPSSAMDEARAAAVADARAKADVLATAAGVTLGDVLSIREGGGANVPGPMVRGMAMEQAAVPIAGGEVDTRTQVSIIFAIAE